MLTELRLVSSEGTRAALFVRGILSAEGGLPLELLFRAFFDKLGVSAAGSVHRRCIEMDWTALR